MSHVSMRATKSSHALGCQGKKKEKKEKEKKERKKRKKEARKKEFSIF
jgi:hypothetical protein